MESKKNQIDAISAALNKDAKIIADIVTSWGMFGEELWDIVTRLVSIRQTIEFLETPDDQKEDFKKMPPREYAKKYRVIPDKIREIGIELPLSTIDKA